MIIFNQLIVKNFFLFTSLLSFFAQPIVAQESALAKIHYKFSHVNDTNKREQPQCDEVVLYMGKESSFYKSYSDDRVKQSIASQKLLPDYSGHITLELFNTVIKHFYILLPKQEKTIELESISSSFDAYYREIPYETQKWEILDETRVIGGYLCQKAITFFKGRDYIVWFTTEIPFPFGPWKLHGLPGLILSAQDALNEVKFEYAGFDLFEPKDTFLIEVPFYVKKASIEEVQKQKHAFLNDQGNYFQILNSSGKMAIANSYYEIDYSKNSFDFKSDGDYTPSFIVNNPIEKVK